MHNQGFKIVRGREVEAEVHVQDLMEQHPVLFCTLPPGNSEYSSVDEAWLV